VPIEFDLVLLALTLWGEARGELLLGKLAVAYVICNRMRRLGCQISQIVLKPYQFSFWNTEDPSRWQISNIDATSKLWLDCMGAAKAALYMIDPDPTNGAEFYMNVDLVKKQRGGTLPKWWSVDTKAEGEVKIGQHTFRQRK
jgi:spore germination cell wall hydrolase CwlJ-like protein